MAKAWWKKLAPKFRIEYLESREAIRDIGAGARLAALRAIRAEAAAVGKRVCSLSWMEAWEVDAVAYPPVADSPSCSMRTAHPPLSQWESFRGGRWRPCGPAQAAFAATAGMKVRLVEKTSARPRRGVFIGEELTLWPAYYVSAAGCTEDWRAWHAQRQIWRLENEKEPDKPKMSEPVGDSGTTVSPSAEAVRRLGVLAIDGAPVMLEDRIAGDLYTERDGDLQAEIDYYQRTGKRPKPLPRNHDLRAAEMERRKRRDQSRRRRSRNVA